MLGPLTLMIVFIFSVISEQDAHLLCLDLFQITTLEFVSNPMQWHKPKSRKKKWASSGTFKLPPAIFLLIPST